MNQSIDIYKHYPNEQTVEKSFKLARVRIGAERGGEGE